MISKDKLNNIRKLGRQFTNEYEKLLKELDDSAILTENESLKEEVLKLKATHEEMEKDLNRLSVEKQELQLALKEQIFSERLNILKISREKIELYFKQDKEANHNRLTLLEIESRRKLAALNEIVEKELIDERNHLSASITELGSDIKARVNSKLESLKRYDETVREAAVRADNLASEEISEDVLTKRIKQNSFEIKLGLKWLNWIGMLLILLGVGSLVHWSYYNLFTEWMKGLFAFLIGIIFVFIGEKFNLKGKGAFGLGLTGGGIAILYYAVFNSYFTLGIIDLQIGVLLSIIITAIAFTFSVRYRSKTICTFALLGGYLPFFAYTYHYGLSELNISLAIGYFALLHLLTLLIAFKHRWVIINYISFLLNLPTLLILIYASGSQIVNIGYSFYLFLLYLCVVLAYPLKNKQTLGNFDIALLAANTAASFSILYYLFQQANITEYRGLMTVLFSLVFFALARFTKHYSPGEEKARVLFYITALTFVILFIPFQFRLRWLALGWLVEAVLLVLVGKSRRIIGFERSGWIIFFLCIGALVTIDLPHYLAGASETLFAFKYTVITTGAILLLFSYLVSFKKEPSMEYSKIGIFIRYYKYILVINFWLYVAYISNYLYSLYLVPLFDGNYIFVSQVVVYHQFVIFGLATLLSGLVLTNVSIIKDKITSYLTTFIFGAAVFVTLILNTSMPSPYFNPAGFVPYRFVAAIIIVVYNLLVLFGLREMLIRLMREVRFNAGYYPLIIALYLMGTVTALLIIQFNLGELNLLLSLFYLLLAFTCILIGFHYGYIYLRRFGLGLSLFSTGKLFLFDLAHLSDISRVLAFFAFGLTMLAISYTYHRLNLNRGDTDKKPK